MIFFDVTDDCIPKQSYHNTKYQLLKRIYTGDAHIFPLGTLEQVGDRQGDYEPVNFKRTIEHLYELKGKALPESMVAVPKSAGLVTSISILPWEELLGEGYHTPTVFSETLKNKQGLIIAYHALVKPKDVVYDKLLEELVATIEQSLRKDGFLFVQNGLGSEGTDEYLSKALEALRLTHFYEDTLTRVYQESF